MAPFNPPFQSRHSFIPINLLWYIKSYILMLRGLVSWAQNAMKKCTLLFFFFFILLCGFAFAGKTSLTTYYPAPTAAYNKIKLSTNANNIDCTNPINNGEVFVDTSGTLNVCMNKQKTVYPQECYNFFCSYDNTVLNDDTNKCPTFLTGNPGNPGNPCPNGTYPVPTDSKNNYKDTFKVTANTTVLSIVCCSYKPKTCSVIVPAGATACPNMLAPTNNGDYSLVPACTGQGCTAQCQAPYIISGNSCICDPNGPTPFGGPQFGGCCAAKPSPNACDCAGDLMDCSGRCGGPFVTDPVGGCCVPANKGCDGICYSGTGKDSCGTCGGPGPPPGFCDCYGNVIGSPFCGKIWTPCPVDVDCRGVCGGSAVKGCDGVCNSGKSKDICGVCGGNGSECPPVIPPGCTTVGCDGVCNSGKTNDCLGKCAGTAKYDKCDVCGGDGSTCLPVTPPGCTVGCDNVCNSGKTTDCLGKCGGTAKYDKCGVCGGDGSTCPACTTPPPGACDCSGHVLDCADTCGGSAVKDACGVCGGSGILPGACDCSGHVLDCAGTCGGSATVDCAGTCGGTAVKDACGNCAGDGTECGGVCSGTVGCDSICNSGKTLDACGVCGGGVASCSGSCTNGDGCSDGTLSCSSDSCVCSGGSSKDICGNCGGDGTECCKPVDGECTHWSKCLYGAGDCTCAPGSNNCCPVFCTGHLNCLQSTNPTCGGNPAPTSLTCVQVPPCVVGD